MVVIGRLWIFSLQIISVILNFVYIGSADKVPVFFWGENSYPASLPPSSALGSLSSKTFSEKYLRYFTHRQPLVVFVQDALSLEDINQKPSPYQNLEKILESETSTFLPSVDNPVQALEKFKSKTISSSDLDAKSLDKILRDKPEVLIITLLPTEASANRKAALQKNDEIIEKLSKLFDSSLNKMLTGKKSSWDFDIEHDSHRRVARHLQSLDVDLPSPDFVNVSQTFFWYAENITLSSDESDFNGTYYAPTVDKDSNITNSSLDIHLTFDRASEPVVRIKLDLLIVKTVSEWWYVKEGSLHLGNEEIPMATSHIGASQGFSYSCGKMILKPFNSTISNATLHLNRFQMEFMPKRTRFSESFSCSTFFTIPIWMGLFVVILFTAILAMGVYLLFEVKTMDRFDDPKGKSISVPQGD